MIAVGVTTYNRGEIVGRAILSALNFVEPLNGKVVMVDDASTDDTGDRIPTMFAQDIALGRLVLVNHDTNQGVTSAKNSAFERAAGANWVLFLDSDDELIVESAHAVAQVLEAHRDTPVVFFRCVDENNRFVGQRFPSDQTLSLARFATNTSYGEALVAINKKLSEEPPFDGDLRGYEGLGCARRIRQFGPGLLSTVVARRYDQSGHDRLSRPLSLFSRAGLLARGHMRYASIVGSAINLRQRIKLRSKAAFYYAVGIVYTISKL